MGTKLLGMGLEYMGLEPGMDIMFNRYVQHMCTTLSSTHVPLYPTGLLYISLPSLLMLNIDWTCASEAATLEVLRQSGQY